MHQSLGNTEILAAMQSTGDRHQQHMMQQLSMNLSGMSTQATDMGNQAMLGAMQGAAQAGSGGRDSFCGESIPDSIQGHVTQRLGAGPGETQLAGAVPGAEDPSFTGFISSFMQAAEGPLAGDSATAVPTHRPRQSGQEGTPARAIESLDLSDQLGGAWNERAWMRALPEAA